MGLKIEFVERIEKGEKMSALCREYALSRTTGHKWWKRYRESGYAGLEEESRRPKTAPLATAEDIVMAVLAQRDAHPRWGPRKLEEMLRRQFGAQTPSERTIARILRRAHKVRERRKRRPLSVIDHAPDVHAHAPNDVWTVDFKGWWRALNGERCEPLTVRDAYSRFVLAAVMCSTRTEPVREVFEMLFRRYGLPKAIQSDNGTPFVSTRSRLGFSALSAWWASLGIELLRSRPGCPQDNGGHERMHADIAGDVQAYPAEDRKQQQRDLDRWRQEFNHVRPHEALGGKTPADIYKVEEKRRPKPYAYPRHFFVRRVSSGGSVHFGGDGVQIGLPFVGMMIGLQPVDPLHVRAWLHELDLGIIEIVPAVDLSLFERQVRRAKTTKKGAA